jgi:hypothetical protein
VPDYRHVHSALMALITNNAGYNAMTQRIPEDVSPDQIRDVIRETVGDIEDAILPYGIGMLEGLASQGTDMHRLGPPWSSVIGRHAEPVQHGTEQPRRPGVLVGVQRLDPRAAEGNQDPGPGPLLPASLDGPAQL